MLDSLQGLIHKTLAPSLYHILKNPGSALLLGCLVVQDHSMAPFPCVCMIFPLSTFLVEARVGFPTCLQRLWTAAKDQPLYIRDKAHLSPSVACEILLCLTLKELVKLRYKAKITSCHSSPSLFYFCRAAPGKVSSLYKSWKKAEAQVTNLCNAKVLQAPSFPSWACHSLDTVVRQQPIEQCQAFLPAAMSLYLWNRAKK